MLIKKNLFLTILFFFINVFAAYSQINEIRAVWVATNHRLDWPPPTFNIDVQKKSLQEIFDSIKSKNLNTIYFQVRSNGTVMFKSSFEPFSFYIDGKGGMPYDPLQFAIEEAHKRGLSIHAWINVVQVFAGSKLNVMNHPEHIIQKKPQWIVEDKKDNSKSYWLNPGLPEVREYISNLIQELVENYDIDGVHLDYIRYPGKNFKDDSTYQLYGNKFSKDEWRRKNITDLISLINKKIKAVKPHIQLGATPIGIYKNHKGMNGWEGLYEVYQDTKEWLRTGIIDYIAPQVYWSFGDKYQFDILAKDWTENSYGKKVVIGIGAFKDEVKNEIEKMIEYSREIGASGVAFFRYSNIKDYKFLAFSNDVNTTKSELNKNHNTTHKAESKSSQENNNEEIASSENFSSYNSQFLIPALIKKSKDYSEIIIYSETEDEIIVKGETANDSEEILLKTKINRGKNTLSLKKNIENYKTIFLIFQKTNKLMRLKS
ncbi:MAG: family 10 glycosylhydrolase [Melioribacteraceae bacterium]